MYLYCVHVYISPVVQQSLHKPCDRGYEGYPALSPRLSLDLLQQTDKTKKAQQRTSQTAVHHMTHHTLHTHTDSPGCPAEHWLVIILPRIRTEQRNSSPEQHKQNKFILID